MKWWKSHREPGDKITPDHLYMQLYTDLEIGNANAKLLHIV